MIRTSRYLAAILAVIGVVAMVGFANAQGKGKGPGKAKPKHTHLSGKQLVGDKIKTNGNHVIRKSGKYTTSVSVKDGKIAGVHVKHSEKGEVPVKKYKTTKKMAMTTREASGFVLASFPITAQIQDLGTTWIGYSYIDDYGDETIYWFPYEMIYDGDVGAIEYVPLD